MTVALTPDSTMSASGFTRSNTCACVAVPSNTWSKLYVLGFARACDVSDATHNHPRVSPLHARETGAHCDRCAYRRPPRGWRLASTPTRSTRGLGCAPGGRWRARCAGCPGVRTVMTTNRRAPATAPHTYAPATPRSSGELSRTWRHAVTAAATRCTQPASAATAQAGNGAAGAYGHCDSRDL